MKISKEMEENIKIAFVLGTYVLKEYENKSELTIKEVVDSLIENNKEFKNIMLKRGYELK